MKLCLRFCILASMSLYSVVGFAQKDTTVEPRRQKPTAQLEKLIPSIGTYSLTMEQSGRTLTGTMEVKPVVKGFYIERIITTKSEDGKVDSEIRSLITWDPAIQRYRIWRFVPLVPQKRHDGMGWFDGEVFIEEYEIEANDRNQRYLRNYITVTNNDEVKIVNEWEYTDGTKAVRGIIRVKRKR